MDTEKWMPVEGYDNKYEVSNMGRVKSHRKRKHPNNKKVADALNFAGLRIMLDNYFLKKEINIFVSETPMLNVKEAEPLTINLKNNMFIAGKEFIESGSISKELIKKIEEPMLDFNTYTNIVNSL